jgi:hypothetical protein
MGGFPITDKSRPGGGSDCIQVTEVATLGWPIHFPGQDTRRSALWTHTLNLTCAQAKGTKDKISILHLKCPMNLKLNFSVPGYDIS